VGVLPGSFGFAPYDASMESAAPAAPPYVVKPFTLRPFRALMLAASGIGDPASARAFARPYRQVAQRLAAWEADGRLQRDDVPAIYVHEYTSDGITVRGLVGALELDRTSASCPDGEQAVYPHEGVHERQVSELALRMGQMEINPAPILLVHRGPARVRRLLEKITSRTPDLVFSDRAEQVHRLWAVREDPELGEVTGALTTTRALIADGHHRYAAYLRLQHEHPGTAWDRGLVMLVDQSDTPLWLGPIHRTLAGVSLGDLLAACDERVDVTCWLTSRHDALEELGDHVLVLSDGTDWAVLRLNDTDRLAITTLQDDLLPDWGVATESISFHHTAAEALTRARTRQGVAVLMPAPAFDQVVGAAGAGHLLPEKATSFQPKPSLGVLMRMLHDE
jgi:uncharacterized protein (DUF1015 family)